jgi:hypothetical protein
MGLIRPAALLLATVMASPALYHGFVSGEISVQSALVRFLIAVPAAALMLAALRFVTSGYGRRQPRLPLRRRSDEAAAENT